MVLVLFATGFYVRQILESLFLGLHNLVEVILAAFQENTAMFQAISSQHKHGLAVLDFLPATRIAGQNVVRIQTLMRIESAGR